MNRFDLYRTAQALAEDPNHNRHDRPALCLDCALTIANCHAVCRQGAEALAQALLCQEEKTGA